jgi:hypothetical protein
MAALNVGLSSTFDQQRQVINELAISVDQFNSGVFPSSVGIGSTEPTESLDIVGNATISGVTQSSGGFISGIGTEPVQITVTGTELIFTVVGVGSTSLSLF